MINLKQMNSGLNAFRLTFDSSLLCDIRGVFDTVLAGVLAAEKNAFLMEGGVSKKINVEHPQWKFHIQSYGKAPLLWVSNDDVNTYALFNRFFKALRIADDVKCLVDHDSGIVMYCGFFVVGNQLNEPVWHVDYSEGANAYTLITPLYEWNASHGNLLYVDEDGVVQKYTYRVGEAIVFGDGFKHTTESYKKTASLRVLVSMTFGTDKLQYWDILNETIGSQSKFLMLPCGHPRGTCDCLRVAAI